MTSQKLVQVLNKTMDSTTLSPDKVELATIARSEEHEKVGYQKLMSQ